MAANINPIFPKNGKVSWATIATANTAKDGTGTVGTIFTADATNGSRIDTVKVRSLGTNVATVLRIFINNGSTNATAGNNSLYMEQTISATTLSEVAAQTDIEIPVDIVLPAGYKINITIGTTVAAGLSVVAIGGDY
jgi:hypothetical protein